MIMEVLTAKKALEIVKPLIATELVGEQELIDSFEIVIQKSYKNSSGLEAAFFPKGDNGYTVYSCEDLKKITNAFETVNNIFNTEANKLALRGDAREAYYEVELENLIGVTLDLNQEEYKHLDNAQLREAALSKAKENLDNLTEAYPENLSFKIFSETLYIDGNLADRNFLT